MNSDHLILLDDEVHAIMAAREDNAVTFINLNTTKNDRILLGTNEGFSSFDKDIKVLSKTKIGVDTAEFPKRFAFYFE